MPHRSKRNIVEACILARMLRAKIGNDRWDHLQWRDGEVSPLVRWLAEYIKKATGLPVEVIAIRSDRPSMAILARYNNIVRVYLNRDPRQHPDSKTNHVLGAFGAIKEFFHVIADRAEQYVAPTSIAQLVEAIADAESAWSRLPTSIEQRMDSETFAIACAMEFVFPWMHRREYLYSPALQTLGRNRIPTIASALKIPDFVARKLLEDEYGKVSAQVNFVLDVADSFNP